MSTASIIAELGLNCPDGGSFYICQGAGTQFLGCCTMDPCASGTGYCPQDSLRYSAYNKDSYVSIPEENCASPHNSSSWYTCANASPPFMGCCASNPCNEGCSQDDLLAARIGDDPAHASVFLTATATSTSSGTTSTSAASGDDGSTSLSTGAIVGVAIGSALTALIAAILLFFWYKRREANKNKRLVSSGQSNAIPSPYQDSFGNLGSPGYSYSSRQYVNEKPFGITYSPGRSPYLRSPSAESSWMPGYGPSAHLSVSSEGSQEWFLLAQRQQQTYTVSEMDNTEVQPQISELAGSGPLGSPFQASRPGYERVTNNVDED
ncbi:hypothetical protein VP1G_02124 [Cytospora mali]|uniref:Carcinoembryonic antigen-related cell adhesion molecule 1 n=1 Tax=Cytospora mali TaxID=578113 RepID=A0A194USR8_CYTMA|nr:hypothetical protein VP1G_02124 [Valsa mali var. pyri (nom. inval.)]